MAFVAFSLPDIVTLSAVCVRVSALSCSIYLNKKVVAVFNLLLFIIDTYKWPDSIGWISGTSEAESDGVSD